MRGEHRLGVPRGKSLSGVGRTGLHKHRPALRRARQVERAFHLIMCARMIDRPNAVGIGVAPAGPVVEHGIIGPRIPKTFHHAHVLLGALVTVGVADLANAAEVTARLRRPCRDDVPADSTVADVVERREVAREVERFRVSGRGRGDQTDALGNHRQRSERGDRLQPIEGRGLYVVPKAEHVCEKD